MTIIEKLSALTNGTPREVTIVRQEVWYVEVEYLLAGVRCTATLIGGVA